MTYKPGDILLVEFPFSSNLGKKKRPAVVISKEDFNSTKEDIIMLAITSQIKDLKAGEALIDNWQLSGLLKPSAFKSIIFTVEKRFMYKKLGELSERDKKSLGDCLSQIIEREAFMAVLKLEK